MIIQWLAELLADLISGIVGLLPTLTLPDWWGTALDYWADILDTAGAMGYWFPLPLILTLATFILGSLAIAVTVKIVRIVLSFVTLGGGSAA